MSQHSYHAKHRGFVNGSLGEWKPVMHGFVHGFCMARGVRIPVDKEVLVVLVFGVMAMK